MAQLAEVTKRLRIQSCLRLAVAAIVYKELRLWLLSLSILHAGTHVLLRIRWLPLRTSTAHVLHHRLLSLAHASRAVGVLVILVLHLR